MKLSITKSNLTKGSKPNRPFMLRSWVARLQTSWGALGFLSMLCLLTGVAFFLISPTNSLKEKQEAIPKGFDGIRVEKAPIDRKILSQVDILRKESLNESLAKLSFPEMFFCPGTFVEGELWHPNRFPLVPKIGQYDINTILSNRRFLKVFRELADLPRDNAVKFLKEHILEGFKSHKKDLDVYIKAMLPHAKKGEYVSIPITITDTGEPTMHGMRLKVLALILIAGNLELTEEFADIATVVNEARQQYQALWKHLVGGGIGFSMARRDCLYNRQILATGLLKTAPDNAESRALRQKWAGHWKTAKLTHYDAEYTPYDIFSSRGFVGADYSKGEITVRYLGPLSDEEFDHIVKSLLPAKEKDQSPK